MRVTKKQLEAELRQARATIKMLSQDTAFGMLTRPAAFMRYKALLQDRRHGEKLSVVFIDLDKIHNLNKTLTAKRVDEMVRSAFHLRSNDVLFKARYKSGDELIAVIKGEPEGFIKRLSESLTKHGLSATMAYSKAGRSLAATAERLSNLVDEMKLKNQRGTAQRI